MTDQGSDGKVELGYQKGDPSLTHFQYLEDLATASWYAHVLFASIETGIFELLKDKGLELEELAIRGGFDKDPLSRILTVLEKLGLVLTHNKRWSNTLISNRYLTKSSPSYLGDFLLYRRFVENSWQKLATKLLPGFKSSEQPSEYAERNFNYVRAMDQILRLKAIEIGKAITGIEISSPILDVGGGAGALIRYFLRQNTGEAYLLDLPEVIEAAKKIYPDPKDWEGIHVIPQDFRTLVSDALPKFNLIILSNFLHAYGTDEAKSLLCKVINMLSNNGLLLIHDYFPDRYMTHPHKGSLYDINMLLNTYNGRCHSSKDIKAWLKDYGIQVVRERDLSDSSIILAGNNDKLKEFPEFEYPAYKYIVKAKEMGFKNAYFIKPAQVIVGPWVRLKCQYGCPNYGKKLHCPPYTMSHEETLKLLGSYSEAIILESTPPLKEFYRALINLEREAFLSGLTRAFTFGAGPCPICETCPPDGRCRYPHLSRPSMEACGIDVYLTLKSIGVLLAPLREKDQFVKYFGLLLLD